MQHRYFAASNSAEGFKNYYGEVFKRADRLYIIKGGPGTGKSCFMKRFADKMQAVGCSVEYYYCSSDPSSLDGVLIRGESESVGMLDGTPPHTVEPIFPGAREEIINLGQFWNSELLRNEKKEIFALNQKKGAAYERAYSYLRSCGNLKAVTDSLLENALIRSKMTGAVERMVASLSLPSGKAEIIPSLRSAIGMTGETQLDSYEASAEKIYYIGELYGVGQIFLRELLSLLQGTESLIRVSYDPISPYRVDGIFIENTKTAFVLSKRIEEENEKTGYINPKRFADGGVMRSVRGELRYASRLYGDCLEGAVHELSVARIYHFVLEDIYKKAMDFAALSRFSSNFIAEEEKRVNKRG